MSLHTKIWRTALPLLATTTLGLAVAPGVLAQDLTITRPDAVQWGPAPPALPPGAEIAVVTGDPSQEGLYVLLVRLPAGYEVPAHTHPNGEVVTVLSGNLNLSHGEAPSRETGEVLPMGSVVATPADHPDLAHLVWAEEETVIEVVGEGPFEITYLNPEDDPRGAEQPSSN